MTRTERLREEAIREVAPEIQAMLASAEQFRTEASVSLPTPAQHLNPVPGANPTVPRGTKRTFLMPDLEAIRARQKAEAKVKPFPTAMRRPSLTDAEIVAKYPHAHAGTLESHGKLRSIEATLKCGHRVRVHIGDLFQVKMCKPCKEAKRAAEAAAKLKQSTSRSTK